jgi:hypothetical protein
MLLSGRCGSGLRGRDAAKHGAVDGLCIVKEGANDLLEVRDLGRSDPRGLVHRGTELDFSAVLPGGTEVGGVLRTGGHGVIEAEECFCHIVEYANFNGAVGVVPVEVQTDIEVAGPVNGDGVVALKNFNEMASMLFSNVLDPKIINHKAE